MHSFHHLKTILILSITASHAFRGSSSHSPSLKIARHLASAFISTRTTIPKRDTLTSCYERSYSSDLDTAFEWLAKDRLINEPDRHEEIRWFHPSSSSKNEAAPDGTNNIIDEDIKRMPLYPLGAVHIPHSGENYTIINIEQKNVKMAMDLVDGKWDNCLFCASLRARDTNRVASVGTIMQLLDTEDRSISGARTWPGNILPTLNRVVANCRAVGVVEILSIEEHDYGPDDYLIAQVRVHNLSGKTNGDNHATKKANGDDNFGSIAKQVIEDYQKVRSIYINSQSLASNELPKFARNAVQTLPTFDADKAHDETTLWKLVETWQMLCNTIRQSKRTMLQNVVNELSVKVAMQAKGPLELPVKRKNLPLDVQRQLEVMEQHAAQEFIELGMDPILDFQEILSMKDHRDRVKKLAWMIQRERSRLEAKESLIRAFFQEELGEELLAQDLDGDQNEFN